MKPAIPSRYFFSEGIRFACTDCGACCTGAPGIIRISDAEQEALADLLGCSLDELRMVSLRVLEGGGWSIRERENGDCVFFSEGRCSIYPVRPSQCRTFPFWFKNLRNHENWAETSRSCPGIGQGRLYSEEEILALLQEEPPE